MAASKGQAPASKTKGDGKSRGLAKKGEHGSGGHHRKANKTKKVEKKLPATKVKGKGKK